MISKLAIARWYPEADMKSFFYTKLGVLNALDDILVSELRDLANEYSKKELSPAIHDHVTSMLDELSSAVVDKSYPANIDSLCDAPIFPVYSPRATRSLTLRSLDECYLPDKSGAYAKAFEHEVPLLKLSSISTSGIAPLLSLTSFKRHVRTLETAVTRKSVIAEGQRVLDIELTKHYAERVTFFEQ